MNSFHVVGAGLAGLAAAVRLVRNGAKRVTLYEAGRQAGGRCRSFFDSVLNRTIDNGNHLMLSGNQAIASYLEEMDGNEFVETAERARYKFVDVRTRESWSIELGEGAFPSWMLKRSWLPPGASVKDALNLGRGLAFKGDATVREAFGACGDLYEKLVEPLATAVLNTPPESGAAKLLRAMFNKTILRGGRHCRAVLCPRGLGPSLVDPALHWLRSNGASIRLNSRLAGIDCSASSVSLLKFSSNPVKVSPRDVVVLAIPPSSCRDVLPDLREIDAFEAIVNVHFRLDATPSRAPLPRMLGLIGGVAQWVFARRDILSVTVSAARSLVNETAADIAARTWADVQAGLGVDRELPRFRVIKERRATISQTPAVEELRPRQETMFRNLILAGDWVQTGLPATIEGAVWSGQKAAQLAMRA